MHCIVSNGGLPAIFLGRQIYWFVDILWVSIRAMRPENRPAGNSGTESAGTINMQELCSTAVGTAASNPRVRHEILSKTKSAGWRRWRHFKTSITPSHDLVRQGEGAETWFSSLAANHFLVVCGSRWEGQARDHHVEKTSKPYFSASFRYI